MLGMMTTVDFEIDLEKNDVECRLEKKVVHDRWIDRRDLIVGIACTSGLCIRVELIFLDKCVI